MFTPKCLDLNDEDGLRMCIELWTGMWGQTTAGGEWEHRFRQILLLLGWKPAEGVPYLWTFNSSSTHDAIMLTIVDDFIISETYGHEIGDRTCAALLEEFGKVKVDHSVNSFYF